jgi:hypothetical protein
MSRVKVKTRDSCNVNLKYIVTLLVSLNFQRGHRGQYRDRMENQLPIQSVPIPTDVVSSNLDQGEVYNIM